MKRIAYINSEGGVSVVIPAEGARLARSVKHGDKTIALSPPAPIDTVFRCWPVEGVEVTWHETEEEFLQRVINRTVPQEAEAHILPVEDIPAERMFRAAWVLNGGRVTHDFVKCKALAHAKRREMRDAELAPHDALLAKQIPGVSFEEVELEREIIRHKYAGIQTAIDVATTIEELKEALS